MLHWLCGSPSIPLSFSLATVLPRRLASRVSLRPRDKIPRASEHSLRLGLQGSLIPFATLAFVPQCQEMPSYLPSPLEFLSISTDFTPTPTVPVTPTSFKSCSITPRSRVEPWALKHNLHDHLRNALRPVNPDNACTLRITAAAGTKLAGAYSASPLELAKRSLRPEGLHPPRGVAASDFRPLRTIPSCCHP